MGVRNAMKEDNFKTCNIRTNNLLSFSRGIFHKIVCSTSKNGACFENLKNASRIHILGGSIGRLPDKEKTGFSVKNLFYSST